MELGAVSPKTYLLTEDIRTITFDKDWNEGEYKPKPEECMGIIKYGLITKVPLETG